MAGTKNGIRNKYEKEKEELIMSEHENNLGNLFAGVLIGGALGALAGILFAPKSGKELRSDIKEKGSKVFKDTKEIYDDTSLKAKEIIEEARHELKEIKNDIDRHLAEVRRKASDIWAHGKV